MVTALGISPLGTDLGPFGGPGLITVLGVLRVGNNVLSIVYDRYPERGDTLLNTSADNPLNYDIAEVDPRLYADDGTVELPSGKAVSTRDVSIIQAEPYAADEKQILIYTDLPMEEAVEYDIQIASDILGASGEVFAGTQTFRVSGLGFSRVAMTEVEARENRYRDLAMDLTGEGDIQFLQTYEFSDNNDIAIHSGVASLRKRIYRRIITSRGGFVFFPQYGSTLGLKAMLRPGNIQAMANSMVSQIRKEPDVRDAAVVITTRNGTSGTVVLATITVSSVYGEDIFDLPVIEL